MRRVWLVAQREFLAAVMNKGFVIGLLVMPAIVSVLVMVMPRLMSTQGTQIRGEVAVIDPTGQILEGLREGLSPEAISRRRAENARRALENTPAPVREVAGSSSDAAIERAMGAAPRLTIVERPSTADVQGEKRWLTEEDEITWDEVLERWRRRGPANEEFVEMIQRGRNELVALAK